MIPHAVVVHLPIVQETDYTYPSVAAYSSSPGLARHADVEYFYPLALNKQDLEQEGKEGRKPDLHNIYFSKIQQDKGIRIHHMISKAVAGSQALILDSSFLVYYIHT